MTLQYDATTYPDTDGPYSVVVVREVPRPGGQELFHEAVSIGSTWPLAVKCVHGLMSFIGRSDSGEWDGIVDCYLQPEVAAIRRPWSAETLGAYQREMQRAKDEEEAEVAADVLRLKAQLRGIIGIKATEQVADGTYPVPLLFAGRQKESSTWVM